MFIVTLIIFACSACYWALSLTIVLRSLRDVLINHIDLSFADKFTLANEHVSRLYVGQVYLTMINYSLSDAVVVWRAWILWSGSPESTRLKVFIVPIYLLTGSIVSALLVGGWKVKALTEDSTHLETLLNDTQIIGWSLSLGTNFMGTSLIAWKAWEHRQFIRQHYTRTAGQTKVQKILGVLVESGFLYCLTQLSVVVSWFILLPHTSAWLSDILGSAAVQLAGIYLTVVIILAARQRTILNVDDHDNQFTDASSASLGVVTPMSFAPPTAAPSIMSATGQWKGSNKPKTSVIQLRLGIDESDIEASRVTE